MLARSMLLRDVANLSEINDARAEDAACRLRMASVA